MFVNVAEFPGLALWQGLMMLALALAAWGMFYKRGKYFWASLGWYFAFGALLLVSIDGRF